MAQRVECSAPTLSRAASGEQLASLSTVLACVRACGGEEAEWAERRRRAAREVAAVPVPGAGPLRGGGRGTVLRPESPGGHPGGLRARAPADGGGGPVRQRQVLAAAGRTGTPAAADRRPGPPPCAC
nr:hypothetical protein [Streptomyces chrestomyceticus]